MEPSKLPLHTDANINTSAWAAQNLDQDIIHKNAKDLKALQAELHNKFAQYVSSQPVDRIATFRSLEGHESPLYLPYAHMTAKRFLAHASPNPNNDSSPVDLPLPFPTWQVRAAVSFWKTHALHLGPTTDPCPSPDASQKHAFLMHLAQLVNLAHYAHDTHLLSAVHATMRNRLLGDHYASDTELLDAVKFVWSARPFSFAIPARYEEMRRILLTYLLSVRERVVAGQERYFREIVAEMGGEEGEFLEAFNLGQVWWEENGGDGHGGRMGEGRAFATWGLGGAGSASGAGESRVHGGRGGKKESAVQVDGEDVEGGGRAGKENRVDEGERGLWWE